MVLLTMSRSVVLIVLASLILAVAIGRVAIALEGSGDQPASSPFLVGVAARDITPEPGVRLWGYSDRQGPATGTLDPLYAKSIVFHAGADTVALVVLDLGRTPADTARARIRDRVRAAGVDHVMLSATHTHHGPAMEDETAPHAEAIEKAIGDCIEEAMARLQPARIGVGRTTIDVAHNRRKILQDGRCFMLWRNEARIPTAPVDKESGVIKIEAEDGGLLAVLVHFACHPVVMGPSNVEYSADYPGEMARIVQERTGADCLFLQGACGDINPYLDKTPIDQGAVEAMRGVGRACAEAVLDAVAVIEASVPEHPSVTYLEKPVEVGLRWDLTDPGQQEVLRQVYGPAFDTYLGALKPDLAVPLTLLVLNGDLALVGMPGEIFVRYQLDLKANAPLPDTFLCGYVNGYHAYFPTVRDAAAGGYGGTVATYVGLGAGDKLTTEAQVEVGKLSGRLRAVAEPADFILLEETPE